MPNEPTPQGGGLNDVTLAPLTDDRGLSGTGGADGGGASAGAGEPSGGATDRASARLPQDPAATHPESSRSAIGQLAARTQSEEAAEAAALGPADGSLADAARGALSHDVAGEGTLTMGDALRSPGRDIGSGTPGDQSELGGGAPLGQEGGTGPSGAASPGGDGRR
jgi:hypothetical protein